LKGVGVKFDFSITEFEWETFANIPSQMSSPSLQHVDKYK